MRTPPVTYWKLPRSFGVPSSLTSPVVWGTSTLTARRSLRVLYTLRTMPSSSRYRPRAQVALRRSSRGCGARTVEVEGDPATVELLDAAGLQAPPTLRTCRTCRRSCCVRTAAGWPAALAWPMLVRMASRSILDLEPASVGAAWSRRG